MTQIMTQIKVAIIVPGSSPIFVRVKLILVSLIQFSSFHLPDEFKAIFPGSSFRNSIGALYALFRGQVLCFLINGQSDTIDILLIGEYISTAL